MALISQDFITLQQLAEMKNVTRRTVYNWINKGVAPPFEAFGGRNWFHRKEAANYVPPGRGRPKEGRS